MEATLKDIPYGPSPSNVFDLYRPAEPSGAVLIWIHGGSFFSGDKSDSAKLDLLSELYRDGTSIVTINYRLSHEAVFPAPFHDSRRAFQFVRSQATTWDLDPERIALGGASVGAGMALWLGLKPDMADPDSPETIERASTRPKCIILMNGQTSYDPAFMAQEIGDATISYRALSALFDVPRAVWPELEASKSKLVKEASPINHLTKDAPPILSTYSMAADAPPDIHHPRFSLVLKERMDELSCECSVLVIQQEEALDDFKARMIAAASSFLERHLGGAAMVA